MSGNGKDPFASLMTRRVEKVHIDGLPEMEIREAPIKDIKPIMDNIANIKPDELSYRLLGISLYVDGEQLTYERVQRMTADMVGRLMPAMPSIFAVYGIEMEKSEPEGEAAAEDAPPPKGKGSRTQLERSSNLPSPSTRQ